MNAISTERSLRIASWNIHGAIGRDRKCRPERIAAIVDAMDADVVALQEVDGRTHLGRKAEAFETMARLLGGYVVEARLHGKPGREHGNMLWSRWPISRARVHLLPGGFEQRGLIEAVVEAPGGSCRVLATHYGLMPQTRARQATATVGVVANGDPDLPNVLVGDLNEWMPSGPVHRRLTTALPVSLRLATFPARRPLVTLDRLYASQGIVAVPISASAEAADASDHRPLVAELRWCGRNARP